MLDPYPDRWFREMNMSPKEEAQPRRMFNERNNPAIYYIIPRDRALAAGDLTYYTGNYYYDDYYGPQPPAGKPAANVPICPGLEGNVDLTGCYGPERPEYPVYDRPPPVNGEPPYDPYPPTHDAEYPAEPNDYVNIPPGPNDPPINPDR